MPERGRAPSPQEEVTRTSEAAAGALKDRTAPKEKWPLTRTESAEFSLKPVPPFRLDLTAWVLRRRRSNAIDRYDGGKYERTISAGGKVIEMAAIQSGSTTHPILKAEIRGTRVGSDEIRVAKKDLDLLLGTHVELSGLYRNRIGDPRVSRLLGKFRGVKPPRFPSVFETLLNAISCQQVSLAVGLLLLNRLTWKYGRPSRLTAQSASPPSHAFPSPEDLSNLKPDSLRELGYSTRKAGYVVGLAKSIANGGVNLERDLSRMGDEDALQYLQSLPGVGRWSSQYVLLRGLGRLNCFPADDIGAQNGLKRLLGLRSRPEYERTTRIIEPWQPYAGAVYFHLLLGRLEREGVLSGTAC